MRNRFLINLRSVDKGSSFSTYGSRYTSHFSDPDFRTPPSFLGNIGEPLEYRHQEYDDDIDFSSDSEWEAGSRRDQESQQLASDMQQV